MKEPLPQEESPFPLPQNDMVVKNNYCAPSQLLKKKKN